MSTNNNLNLIPPIPAPEDWYDRREAYFNAMKTERWVGIMAELTRIAKHESKAQNDPEIIEFWNKITKIHREENSDQWQGLLWAFEKMELEHEFVKTLLYSGVRKELAAYDAIRVMCSPEYIDTPIPEIAADMKKLGFTGHTLLKCELKQMNGHTPLYAAEFKDFTDPKGEKTLRFTFCRYSDRVDREKRPETYEYFKSGKSRGKCHHSSADFAVVGGHKMYTGIMHGDFADDELSHSWLTEFGKTSGMEYCSDPANNLVMPKEDYYRLFGITDVREFNLEPLREFYASGAKCGDDYDDLRQSLIDPQISATFISDYQRDPKLTMRIATMPYKTVKEMRGDTVAANEKK
ncbi:MAG: hypothetical protein FWE53_01350 [Firmicutes bacterium]|nr:hypothetical protein [Bacillota bacterium]